MAVAHQHHDRGPPAQVAGGLAGFPPVPGEVNEPDGHPEDDHEGRRGQAGKGEDGGAARLQPGPLANTPGAKWAASMARMATAQGLVETEEPAGGAGDAACGGANILFREWSVPAEAGE